MMMMMMMMMPSGCCLAVVMEYIFNRYANQANKRCGKVIQALHNTDALNADAFFQNEGDQIPMQ